MGMSKRTGECISVSEAAAAEAVPRKRCVVSLNVFVHPRALAIHSALILRSKLS